MKYIQNNFFELVIFEAANIIGVVYKKNCAKPKEIIVPILASTSISNTIIIKIFGTYSLFAFLMFLIIKDILTPASATPNTFSHQYPDIGFPVNKYNKKRVLPLFLHCPFQVGQYVIFRQKNKNNSSLIHINFGEIGLIVEKLNGLDQALVDFSIDVPIRFKKLDTKNLVKNAYLECILIIEIKEKK